MVMKSKKSKSKRVSLKKKYKVIRKARKRNLGFLEEEDDSKLLEDSNKNTNDFESTSPKTLLPQLHLLPHVAPTIDATHCQVAGDAANNGVGLHHRSSSDSGFASLKCMEHHNMASMFASLLRLVNIVLLRCYQAIAVDIHHQNVPPKTINSTTPHITVTPFLSIQTTSFPVQFQF
ncbi:hypothetical protein DEO72_LG10g1852 [Vigna unguiculata]|uniref:Uncharacterized protein n=1 Tax=Vigna unguiculata TaxID=3917 RepID=A0A4D6NCK4_VIGUN|nr:hypothetical protein DEO72_LG10g1852 [Vigna unguiculata]